MQYRFVTTDVFTDRMFGGNQLAVFPDARGLDPARMLQIAREFNFAETVFALPPEHPANTRRLRIFTPASELPFAGHPTIGAALMLATIGAVPLTGDETRIRFEEGVGVVPVMIRSRDGVPAFAELTAAKVPEMGPPPPSREVLADVLSLAPGDLLDGDWSPRGASCGLPFLFVPVRDRQVLARARVRIDRWEAGLKGTWAPELFVFSRDPERPGSQIRARMFAPGLSVSEDPATGSACAALAGYLTPREDRREGTLRWVVEQGFEMGRPSILRVEADVTAGRVTAVRVGGEAVMVTEGTMRVPEQEATPSSAASAGGPAFETAGRA
jgi:trans-2,3-dihydro-3-hydroxyanthranilate isomerase